MKNLLLVLFLQSICSAGFTQSRDVPPNAQPGKCYAKCLIVPKTIETTENYFIYTGSDPESVDLEIVEIVIEEGSSEWQKNEMTGVTYLAQMPAEKRTLTVVKDTSQTTEFILESITYLEKEATGRSHKSEWREVLCNDKITKKISKGIQEVLTREGFYQGAITGSMDTATKSALVSFQKKNGLPVGNLDIETIEALDIYY